MRSNEVMTTQIQVFGSDFIANNTQTEHTSKRSVCVKKKKRCTKHQGERGRRRGDERSRGRRNSENTEAKQAREHKKRRKKQWRREGENSGGEKER